MIVFSLTLINRREFQNHCAKQTDRLNLLMVCASKSAWSAASWAKKQFNAAFWEAAQAFLDFICAFMTKFSLLFQAPRNQGKQNMYQPLARSYVFGAPKQPLRRMGFGSSPEKRQPNSTKKGHHPKTWVDVATQWQVSLKPIRRGPLNQQGV